MVSATPAGAAPTPTPTPIPTPTSPPTVNPAWCAGYRLFGGIHWCPADARGVAATRYGTGRRVFLNEVVVTGVEPTKLFGSQHLPCPPGKLCAPECCTVNLRLYWPGSSRPQVADILRLHGRTTEGSLALSGFVKLGVVPPCDPYGDCYPVVVAQAGSGTR